MNQKRGHLEKQTKKLREKMYMEWYKNTDYEWKSN